MVFVYDSTNPASFSSLAHWIEECKKHSVTSSDDTPHILIGNKCDLSATARVSTSDAQVGGGRACAFLLIQSLGIADIC